MVIEKPRRTDRPALPVCIPAPYPVAKSIVASDTSGFDYKFYLEKNAVMELDGGHEIVLANGMRIAAGVDKTSKKYYLCAEAGMEKAATELVFAHTDDEKSRRLLYAFKNSAVEQVFFIPDGFSYVREDAGPEVRYSSNPPVYTYDELMEYWKTKGGICECKDPYCTSSQPPRFYHVILDGEVIGGMEWEPGWDDISVKSYVGGSMNPISIDRYEPVHLGKFWACLGYANMNYEIDGYLANKVFKEAMVDCDPTPPITQASSEHDRNEFVRSLLYHLTNEPMGGDYVQMNYGMFEEPAGVDAPINREVTPEKVIFGWLYRGHKYEPYVRLSHEATARCCERVLKGYNYTLDLRGNKATLTVNIP